MRDENEVSDLADKASTLSLGGSKYPGMTYEQGVRDALDWVLENWDDSDGKPLD